MVQGWTIPLIPQYPSVTDIDLLKDINIILM